MPKPTVRTELSNTVLDPILDSMLSLNDLVKLTILKSTILAVVVTVLELENLVEALEEDLEEAMVDLEEVMVDLEVLEDLVVMDLVEVKATLELLTGVTKHFVFIPTV